MAMADIPLDGIPDRPEPPEGLPGYYACDHGVSNVPCLCHFIVAASTGQPAPETQPDDWHHAPPVPEPGPAADASNN